VAVWIRQQSRKIAFFLRCKRSLLGPAASDIAVQPNVGFRTLRKPGSTRIAACHHEKVKTEQGESRQTVLSVESAVARADVQASNMFSASIFGVLFQARCDQRANLVDAIAMSPMRKAITPTCCSGPLLTLRQSGH
jgi:hypothetical protein